MFHEVWKLHSIMDYAYFFLVAAGGALVFYLWTRRLKGLRDDVQAARRVGKKLARWGKVYRNVCFFRGEEGELQTDFVLVDQSGVVLVKAIGWGIRLKEEDQASRWRLSDLKNFRVIDNPIYQLQPAVRYLEDMLDRRGVDLRVNTLIVLADPYDRPVIPERLSNVVGYQDLDGWLKRRKNAAGGKKLPSQPVLTEICSLFEYEE